MAEKVKRIRRPSAQRWKLARLPKGPLQLKGASEFCQLLMGLMARLKQIGPGDKMILAYIAEKIWSQGKYMQPLEKLAADTQPTWWSDGAQQMSYKMCVLHSLEYRPAEPVREVRLGKAAKGYGQHGGYHQNGNGSGRNGAQRLVRFEDL